MTDTNQASELYKLCKKVYELTGWLEDDCNAIRDDGAVFHTSVDLVDAIGFTALYTSDYLLEKLPNKLGEKWLNLSPETSYKGLWIAEYQDNKQVSSYIYFANTPLKALLKLTIALSKAGELKR